MQTPPGPGVLQVSMVQNRLSLHSSSDVHCARTGRVSAVISPNIIHAPFLRLRGGRVPAQATKHSSLGLVVIRFDPCFGPCLPTTAARLRTSSGRTPKTANPATARNAPWPQGQPHNTCERIFETRSKPEQAKNVDAASPSAP